MFRKCCFIFSLKTGFFIASLIYLIIFIAEILAEHFLVPNLTEELIAVLILRLCILFVSSGLLFFAALTEERFCGILFAIFNITTILVEIIGLIILLHCHLKDDLGIIFITYISLVSLFFLYMIPISIKYSQILRKRHAILNDRINPVNDLNDLMGNRVIGY